MEEPKKVKNTTTNYPQKVTDENKVVRRRSDKYQETEVKNLKEKVKKTEKIEKNEKTGKTIKEEKTEKSEKAEKSDKTEKTKEKKTIEHKHAPDIVANKNKETTSLKNKTGDNDMPKKRTRKKKKIDPNSIIFFAIVLFVACIIFLKTMGVFMSVVTIVGIILIIACSLLLKKIRKNKVVRIITNIILIIFLLGCIAGVCGITYFAYLIVTDAPEWDPTQLNKKETTILYDSNGVEYAELGTEKRELITYDETSENLINAIIATEDSRFFQHNGFDALRFFKAGVSQVLGNSDAGGASTLSMQVVKNVFTDANLANMNSEGIKRKFTDIYLAVFKLEKEYTKEAIFEFYINNHFLGNNAYGVEQASQTYFGKPASELTLSEAALIAGMFQAPSSYNPFTYPEAAAQRRSQVLNLMYNHGYITAEERDIANSIPVESLLTENTSTTQKYQSYIDLVVEELETKHGLNPYSSSLKIYTNIDLEKQQGLEDIFSGKTFDWLDDKIQAGIAAVDVWTGKITAISGGRNYVATGTHRGAKGNRQIGSTAKPIFDYAPGMEYNNWSTYTLFDDSKYYYSSGQEIRNADRSYMGTITLREALAQSRNVPALKAFQQVKNSNIYNFVTSLGITPETTDNSTYVHEAHSIGSFNGSNPLEMAAAYAAFANGGIYYEPYTISKIVYRDSGETIEVEPNGTRVMSDSTAFMMTYCLQYAVTNGLSSGAAVKGVNVAAKTGTTNFDEATANYYNLPSYAVNDGWIIGFDPDTAVGMWIGYDSIKDGYLKSATYRGRNVTTERNGLYQAAGKVLFTSNGKEFEVPDSVVKVKVEKGTNPAKLASSSTPSNMITYEYFKKGTEPTEISTTYNKLKNVTNLKAEYEPLTNKVYLSWSAASANNDYEESYGQFGYKVYFNDKYQGFTTDTYFTISETDPSGTYKVITTYENYSDTDSSGATTTIDASVLDTSFYTSSINFQTSYVVGEEISSCLTSSTINNSCITLYKDGQVVTDGYTTTITIKDTDGDNVSIDNSFANNYIVTLKVKYNGATRITDTIYVNIK